MKKIVRRLLSTLLLAVIFLGFPACKTGEAATDSRAVGLPSELTIIVPWGVDGGVDIVARKIAQMIMQQNDMQVTVENHTGASGTVAMHDLLDAAPDGSTIIVSNGPIFTLTPYFIPVTYSLENITALVGLRTVDGILLTNPAQSGIRSLKDLVAYGKENGICFGTSGGPGNDQYTLLMTLFKQLDIRTEAIIYDGQRETVNALADSQVDLAVASPPVYYAHAQEKTILPIATFMPQASKTPFGTVPPVNQLAGVDVEFMGIDFFACRADVPEHTKNALRDMIIRVYEAEEFQEYLEELGFDFWNADTQEIMDALEQQSQAMVRYAQ